MSTYARVVGNIVAEIIPDVQKVQVPAPLPFTAGTEVTPEMQAQSDEQQAMHDSFTPGVLPLSDRFHPDVVAQMHEIPDGDAVNVGDTFDAADDKFIPAVAPVTSIDNLQEYFTSVLDNTLDEFAQGWGYTDMMSAATYMLSTVPRFQHEAQALTTWRDSVWVFAEQLATQVKAGNTAPPASPSALKAMMPQPPARPS